MPDLICTVIVVSTWDCDTYQTIRKLVSIKVIGCPSQLPWSPGPFKQPKFLKIWGWFGLDRVQIPRLSGVDDDNNGGPTPTLLALKDKYVCAVTETYFSISRVGSSLYFSHCRQFTQRSKHICLNRITNSKLIWQSNSKYWPIFSIIKRNVLG